VAPKTEEAWYGRGEASSALGKFEDATDFFSLALEINDGVAAYWHGRGFNYLMLKQWDRAIDDYTKAIDLAPKAAAYRHQRGDAYLGKEKWDKALADYSAALENQADGNHTPAWTKRADLYARLGQWQKAKSDYEEAIKRIPKNGSARNSLVWLLATCPESSVRDPGRAVEVARGTVEYAPTWGIAWITLGVAQYRAGDWKEALAALTRGLELERGNSGPAGFFLTMTQHKLGDKEAAAKTYDRAVEWMEKNQPKDEELIRFRKEAAELLGITNRKN
jgi:tetratricopeptide (TPR) repeat protein